MTASNRRSESLFPPAGTNSMYDTSVFDLAKVCLSVIYICEYYIYADSYIWHKMLKIIFNDS